MIFKDQSSLRIRLTTGVDITAAGALRVQYRKPGGTLSYFTATSEDDSTGVIYYDFAADDLDESGVWTFWAFVTFSDGRSAAGEAINVQVYEPGTVVEE